MTLLNAHHRPVRLRSFLSQAGHVVAVIGRSPLVVNGYALVASAGVTSALGLVFWGLAAHLYTPEQVGLGAALISTMLTLGNISQLNLGNFLNRYLPPAGGNALRLVLSAYALAASAAAILSALAVFFASHLVEDLSFLREQPLSAAGFVVATVAWTLFALQDSVLAGLRRSTVVPIENALFSAAKLLLLALFANSALLGSGLYAAWVLPLPLLLAVINSLVFFRFLPQHRFSEAAAPGRQALARYFGWDYVGTLASMATMGIAPLVVLHYGGSSNLAVYYISWEVAYGVYLIGRSMGISLLAEAAFDAAKLRQLAIEAMIYTTVPLAGVVLVLLFGAPMLLTLLGSQYSEVSPILLQLLALSCLPWSVVTLILAVARAIGRTEVVAMVQVATLLIVLGLGTPLVIAHGPVGMAAAWFLAHCVIATGLLVSLSLRLGPSGRLEIGLRLLSSLARLYGHTRPRAQSSMPLEPPIAQFCAATGIAAADPRTIREFRRESDVCTALFETSETDGERLIFKSASSAEGRGALIRHIVSSQALAAEPLLEGLGFASSKIIACRIGMSEVALVEHAWPGEDGRAILSSSRRHFPALAHALAGIAEIHARTAVTATIDSEWVYRWVGSGADATRRAKRLLLGEAARAAAIAVFIDEQRQFWLGRRLPLGVGHGDFCPGNLLFATGPGETDARVTAIIDWEAATFDCPPALDAMFMLLTARALRNGEELGFAVRHMLEDPELTRDEEAAMGSLGAAFEVSYGSLSNGAAIRALCGLAWWRHVATNLTKTSSFAGKSLWVSINVDLVLASYNRNCATAGGPWSTAIACLKDRKMQATEPVHPWRSKA
jgi:O-antigen/teichoic acid export membrane protein